MTIPKETFQHSIQKSKFTRGLYKFFRWLMSLFLGILLGRKIY